MVASFESLTSSTRIWGKAFTLPPPLVPPALRIVSWQQKNAFRSLLTFFIFSLHLIATIVCCCYYIWLEGGGNVTLWCKIFSEGKLLFPIFSREIHDTSVDTVCSKNSIKMLTEILK